MRRGADRMKRHASPEDATRGDGPVRRIVIVGGGHGGVSAARRFIRLRRPGDRLEITVISKENVEVWHGLMPQIVAALVQPQQALVPLRMILPGVTIYPYEVERIDLAERRVFVTPGEERDQLVIEYDYLLLSLGSVTDLSRFPGLIEHGLQTKTMGDIVHLRNHLIGMLERASVERNPEERRRMLTFVVVGAGWSGVEIASQANDLLHEGLRFYPAIRPEELRVTLLSNAARILPAIDARLARRAEHHLKRCGVELRLSTGLRAATANSAVLTNGEVIATHSIITTVGIGTNPVIARLPVELIGGRMRCDEQCRVVGWPAVYAVGDNAAIPDRTTGKPYQPTAIFAFSQGRHVAENILADARGEPLAPYNSVGLELALLSKSYGLVKWRFLRLSGAIAAIAGRIGFVAYMPTWRHRFTLIQDWLASALFARDITQMRFERSDAVVRMRFGAGEVIIREGDPASRFYIITDGEVEVVHRTEDGKEERLAVLGAGQYFGEIALLYDVTRTATVRAVVDTTVVSIARQDFGTLVTYLPGLRESLSHSPAAAASVGHDLDTHES